MANVNLGFDGEDDPGNYDVTSGAPAGEHNVPIQSNEADDPPPEVSSRIVFNKDEDPPVEKRIKSFQYDKADEQPREINIPIVYDKTDEAEKITDDAERAGKLATLRRLLYRRRGLLFAIASALFFSFEDVLMDLLSESLNVFQITSMANSLTIIISAIILYVRRIDRPKGKYQWLSLLVSGSLLALGMPTALLSLKYMEIGASISVIYTMPIFAGIAGWIFLKEKLKLIHGLFVLLSFGGVLLIAQPEAIFGGTEQDPENNLFLGTIFGLISAVTFALLIVMARKQTMMGIHTFVMMFCNAGISCVFGAVVCTILQAWSMPSISNWFEMIGFAVSDFVAQMFIFMAIVMETAMLVSIAATSEVIFAFILQIIIFQDLPDWLTITGAVLIVISCVGVAVSSPEHTVDQDAVDEEVVTKNDEELPNNGHTNDGVIPDDVAEDVGDVVGNVTNPEKNGGGIITGEKDSTKIMVQLSDDKAQYDVADVVDNSQDLGIRLSADVSPTCENSDGSQCNGDVTHL